ncbi:hypothetical protein PACTADRAFT_48075 [Pachysolen tannophilus NRRL Y-2460]|uniref:CBM21 domain-containing protein n=1 Tax=Pachysolen tannophilus NRRL Y-2460 TaxID=669874 RepID=A0A1E4U2S2_PACTA|nr:hypothetical protein PACTADRAFT_48075 [Pachysolen tannophilus NRRL Y-2460]
MPYLGPTTLESHLNTSPLTTKNLAYLNETLNPKPSDSIASDSFLSMNSPKLELLDIPLSLNASSNLSPSSISTYSSTSSGDDDGLLAKIRGGEPSAVPRESSSSSLSTIVPAVNNKDITALRSLDRRSSSTNGNNRASTLSDLEMQQLIRKKSGELLKSSLRLPDLTRSRSMPNTGKSVRFASNLEDVKLFEKTGRPIAVSTENSPTLGATTTTTTSTTKRKPKVSDSTFSWDSESNSSDSDDESFMLAKANSWKVVSSNVKNFYGIDYSKNVILTRIEARNSTLVGLITVKNIAFDKKINLRLSIDGWKSLIIIQANYKRSLNDHYDQFEFDINISSLNFKFFETTLTLDLCIEYQVNNQVFWDNNMGKNYRVIMEKSDTENLECTHKNLSKTSNYIFARGEDDIDDDYFSCKNVSGLVDLEDDFHYKLRTETADDNNAKLYSRYSFNLNNKSPYTFNDVYFSRPSPVRTPSNDSNETITAGVAKDDAQSTTTSSSKTKSHSNSKPKTGLLAGPSQVKNKYSHKFTTHQGFNSTSSLPDAVSIHDKVENIRKGSTGKANNNIVNEAEYQRLVKNYCYAFN